MYQALRKFLTNAGDGLFTRLAGLRRLHTSIRLHVSEDLTFRIVLDNETSQTTLV